MKTGICTLPLIPLRSEPSERSEMISQVLFGELAEVLEEKDSWIRIQLLSDLYSGWCTKKMLQIIPESIYLSLMNVSPAITGAVLSPCFRESDETAKLFLPAGSRLYSLNKTSGLFPIQAPHSSSIYEPCVENWFLDARCLTSIRLRMDPFTTEDIVKTAIQFLNAPYLWGGKCILGVDCSGLVQVVYSIFGFSLPRDASDQALQGENISDITKTRSGDLAFFSNPEGKVIHVGIMVDDHTIIHSSGSVHIDRIDSTGIYSDSLGFYTHRLHSFKRLIPASNA